MRRYFTLVLAVLLLCGCHAQPEETTAPTTVPTEPTPGLYDPNNSLEEMTDGAVRAFSLEGHSVTGTVFMGDQLLLLTMDDHVELTTLLALRGDNLGIARSVTLDCALYADEVTVSTDGQTLGYYNAQENSVVLLDRELAETRRIRLPDQVADTPVLSPDLTTLYYCSGSEIYALDLESGIPRLLKQHSCTSQSLAGLHFDGTVLEVFLTLDTGVSQVAFISTENGETIGTDRGLVSLESDAERYLLQRLDGTVTEILVGRLQGDMHALSCGSETVEPAFPLNAVVGVGASTLNLYDLGSGEITSRLALDQQVQVQEVCPDPAGGFLWLRVLDLQADTPLLLRWDVKDTEVVESTAYLKKRYTADDPDLEGIAACQQQADTIGTPYGIRIDVGGSFSAPEGCSYVPEHQVQALEKALAQLDATLSQFPAELLQGLATVNKSGAVCITLVRDIRDIAGNSVSDAGGLHYVLSGDHHIALTVGGDLEIALAHQLCHVLDSYVFAHSTAYDRWDTLNPGGFAYFGSYDYEAPAQNDPNLMGDTQAFISSYAMTFAKEDRAAIFAAAVEAGNDALFAAPGLQAKLRFLCDAIRQAYGWQETDLTLPWEQYLP